MYLTTKLILTTDILELAQNMGISNLLVKLKMMKKKDCLKVKSLLIGATMFLLEKVVQKESAIQVKMLLLMQQILVKRIML